MWKAILWVIIMQLIGGGDFNLFRATLICTWPWDQFREETYPSWFSFQVREGASVSSMEFKSLCGKREDNGVQRSSGNDLYCTSCMLKDEKLGMRRWVVELVQKCPKDDDAISQNIPSLEDEDEPVTVIYAAIDNCVTPEHGFAQKDRRSSANMFYCQVQVPAKVLDVAKLVVELSKIAVSIRVKNSQAVKSRVRTIGEWHELCKAERCQWPASKVALSHKKFLAQTVSDVKPTALRNTRVASNARGGGKVLD